MSTNRVMPETHSALALAFGRPVADEALAGRVRALQIRGILRLTPYTIFANLVNMAVVVLTVGRALHPAAIAVWCLALTAVLAIGGRAWIRNRRRRVEHASRRAIDSAVRQAVVLALIWAFVPVFAYDAADHSGRLLLATLTTGMICAGGFALATVPAAAVAWVAVLGVAAMLALTLPAGESQIELVVLLVTYCGIVVASTLSTARHFVARFLVEAELERRGDVIHLLLHEFEETASDWLWETDDLGFLQRVSPRFAAVSGRTAEELHELRLVDLTRPPIGHPGHVPVAGMRAAMQARQHFREAVVPVSVAGEERWWSMSGKPFHDDAGGFRGYRGVGSDVTDARRAASLVAHMADHDALTGLGNRSWFRRQVATALSDAMDGGPPAALCLIDLDHFKAINDSRGHPVGDALLCEVASRFHRVCGPGVALARIGGDEFAALGRHWSRSEAERFGAALLAALEQPVPAGGAEITISITIGIATGPEHGATVDDLMRTADIALYEAKRAGRGRYCVFETEMEAEIGEKRRLEADLREAIAADGLELAFQPIVSAADETVLAYEALLRWTHATRGPISPAIFIPLAEEAGLIHRIGEWVIDEACRTAAAWHEPLRVSVNLSPLQFVGRGLAEMVASALERSRLAPARLELEITESAIIRDSVAAAETLDELRGLGVRIALDDFGTGYASLSYLRQYPIQNIKIDRSFVSEIGSRGDAVAIIRAIVMLAQTMAIDVTAEGVETRIQADVLKALGCTALQGYLYGRPTVRGQVSDTPAAITAA